MCIELFSLANILRLYLSKDLGERGSVHLRMTLYEVNHHMIMDP